MFFKVLNLDIKKQLLNRRIQITILLIPIVSVASLYILRYQITSLSAESIANLPEVMLIKKVYVITLITIMLAAVVLVIESIQIERRENNWFLWLRFGIAFSDIFLIKILSNWTLILISIILTVLFVNVNYLILYLMDPLPTSQVGVLDQLGFFSLLLTIAIPYLFAVTIFHCVWCFLLKSNVIQLIFLLVFPLISLFSFLKYLPNGLLTNHILVQQAIATPNNYLEIDILMLVFVSLPLVLIGRKLTHYSILSSF